MTELLKPAKQWRAMSTFLMVWLLIGAISTHAQGQTPTPTPLRPLPTATPDINATPTPQPNELFILTPSVRALSEGDSITITLTPAHRLSRTVSFTLRAGIAVRGDEETPDVPLLSTRTFTFAPTTPRVSFTLNAPDERVAFGPNAYLRFVTEGAFVSPFNSIAYLDNDAPVLGLHFDRSTIREGNVRGGRAMVTVTSNTRLEATALQITTNERSLVFGPVQLLGVENRQSHFVFLIIAPDNQKNGPRTALIRVAARGVQPIAPLTILDGDAPFLRLQFDPPVVVEGESTRVTVKREGDLSQAVTVRLMRSAPIADEFRAFANLRLAPGQATGQTSIAVLADGLVASDRYELVRAESPGLVTALETLHIVNREPRIEAMVSPETAIEGQSPTEGVLALHLNTRFVRDVPVRLSRFGRRLRFAGQGEATSQIVTLPADGSLVRMPFTVINNELLDVEGDGGTVREGFIYSMSFPGGYTNPQTGTATRLGDAVRRVFVNVVDDEAPISLRFSASFIRDLSTLQLTLTVDHASSVAREFVLRLEQVIPQETSTFPQEFLLELPAGLRSLSFPCPTGFSTSSDRFLRAVIRPREGGLRAAAYANFDPIYIPEVFIAENGPPEPVTLSRHTLTRAVTARLYSDSVNRFTAPSNVTFRAGQRDVEVAVRPIDDAQHDGDYFGSLYVPLGTGPAADFAARRVIIVDDDTLLPAADETPSDATFVRARFFAPEPMATGSVGVDLLFDNPVTFANYPGGGFGRQAFAISINGVPKSSALTDINILSSGDVRLVLQDPALRPGARLTLTPINVRDRDGLSHPTPFLRPIPITLLVPSILPRRIN